MNEELEFLRREIDQFVSQLKEIAAGTHIDPDPKIGVQRVLAYHLNRAAEFAARQADAEASARA